MPELLILETVVEQQRVAPEVLHGVASAFDSVFIDEHHDVRQVCRKHVRFVAAHFAVEEQVHPVRDDARRRPGIGSCEAGNHAVDKTLFLLAVSAAKYRHLAPLGAQLAGEFLDHRGFAGSADRHVADADNLTAKLEATQNALVVEVEARLHNKVVDVRKPSENPKQKTYGPLLAFVITGILYDRQ